MKETYIITSGSLAHNPPAKLHGMQVLLEPYLPHMLFMWWVLFFGTFCFLMVFLLRKYREGLAAKKRSHTHKH